MALIPEKVRKFFAGRRGQFERIEAACRGVDNIVWVHSASYGEFEEARPVIEKIRIARPDVRILATFFSPSGYEYHKDGGVADFVFYLPLDTIGNARRFLDIVRPVKVIVSISDYWLNFLNELRRRKIDTYLISARFEPGMRYFKPLGAPYRHAFRECFTKIMVRDEQSRRLLEGIGVEGVEVLGDPRMDRVLAISAEDWGNGIVERWAGGERPFVAGSTLPIEDDAMIARLANEHPDRKFLIIPHETDAAESESIRRSVNGRSVLFTEAGDADDLEGAQVLIVNTVGMLSRLYRYGFAAYVGGGFDGSPHSIVEPAAYGIPVSYGPQFGSHYHCRYLMECGGGMAVRDYGELRDWYDGLIADKELLRKSGDAARAYCEKGRGVSDKIVKHIFDGN